jgi:hypothetical protein
MATINPVAASTAGVALTYAAATVGGDSLVTGTYSRVALLVRNASGSSITLTLAGAVPCSQGSLHSSVYTCAVGDTEIRIPASTINTTTGAVAITYSAVTSITVAAVGGN